MMKVRTTTTLKMRIFSAFLAFVIIFVSLPYVGWTGIDADAANITTGTKISDYMNDGKSGNTTHDGYSVSNLNSGNEDTANALFQYTYTGKVKSTKIEMYDYKSDAEISGGTLSSYYTDYGCEPFDQFNMAISKDFKAAVESQNQNNITIRLKVGVKLTWWNNVYVYLFDDSSNDSGSIGDTKYKMTYDSTEQDYYLTLNLVDNTATNYLSFTPTRLYFYNEYYNGSSASEEHNKTSNINATLIPGYTYRFQTYQGNTTTNYYEDYNSNLCKVKRLDKTTIIFNDVEGKINDSNNVYIYLWDKDERNNVWPGEKMTPIGGNKYKLEFYGDYGKNNGKDKNFDPYNFILTKGNDNKWLGSGNLSFGRVLKYGWEYEFRSLEQSDGSYKTTVYSATNPTRKALYTNAKVCKYENPLYFGCYYRTTQESGTYADDFKPDGVSSYLNMDFGGSYNNFWWQANLGQKSIGNGTGSNSVDVRGHAAVQGLVDQTLLDGTKLSQNGIELPYFSSAWRGQTGHSDLITIYNNGGEGIDFPFYEIKSDATKVRGTVSNTSAEARFYQFNSADNTLYFHENGNNSYFEETDIQIQSNNGHAGFFPFNDTTSRENKRIGVSNNVGFGTKFEMRFKLKENGKVYPVDSNGNEIKDNTQMINTMFEFIGDDDLWVFIDGNLVLDLGGCHDKTSGLIDFAEKKAYANKALKINAVGNDKDDLGATVGIQVVENNASAATDDEKYAFTNKLADAEYIRQNGGKYNKDITHTMTIFYMERGMMDSNLLVRFNFTPESTFSKMKIAEVTDFSKVNDGLKSYARKAADGDVFKYTVANSGTKNSDVVGTGILYPTYDQYDRVNQYKGDNQPDNVTTILTKKVLDSSCYETITDTSAIFLNAGVWDVDNAVIGAIVWDSSDNDKFTDRLYIGKKISGNIYKFDRIPSTGVDYVRFIRLDPGVAYVAGGFRERNDYSNNWGAYTNALSLNRGKLYSGVGWGTPISGVTASSSNYSYEVVKYDQDIYQPGTNPSGYRPVANTNYLWEDNFKNLNGTEVDKIKGMTGKTDGSGNLYLMYGSGRPYGDGKESSAEFENAFRPATVTNSTPSSMRIIQSDTLSKPVNVSGSHATLDTVSGRTVGTYYRTTVQLFDRQNNIQTLDNDLSGTTTYQTTFPFAHVNANADNPGSEKYVPEYLTVMLTEVFTNTVKVGAISVRKELKYSETGPEQVHTFRLSLSNIMATDVQVTDYGNIPIQCTTATNPSGKLNQDGTFTILGTGTATITGIPAKTDYTITEITPGSFFEYDSGEYLTGTVEEGEGADYSTPVAGNRVVVTNKRKVGNLTLSKSLVCESNAKSGDVGNDTLFTFTVTIKEPEGVLFTNYSITNAAIDSGNLIETDSTTGQHTYRFTRSVSKNSSVTLTGIPYGTIVGVTEVQDSNNRPYATYAYTDGSGTTYTNEINHPLTVMTVTNTYRKITLTKKDSADNTKGLQSAEYYLLRMKENVNAGDARTAFEEANSHYNTAPLTNYFDVSGTVTTGSDGTVEVRDADVSNGLIPGDYYFFEETAPDGYVRQNSFTKNKITINTSETGNGQYSMNLTNVRKTGSLELRKVLASGTSGSQNFTFNVTLDGTADNLKLSLYGITGFTTVNYNDSNHTATGTVTVASGGSAVIGQIPFGTTYTVSEVIPSGWKETSTVYSDDPNKKIDTETPANDTVTITNAKTGSLVLRKVIDSSSDSGTDHTTVFTYHVVLTAPSGVDLEQCITGLSGKTNYAHTTNTLIYSFDESVLEGADVTISGIPHGTGYVVTETGLAADWTQTGSENVSDTISSDSVTAAYTNKYEVTTPPPVTEASVTITKTDTRGNVITDSRATYYLLKLNSTFDTAYAADPEGLSDIFKNAGSVTALSSYCDGSAIGPKQTDASGKVTFNSTEGVTTGAKYFFYESQAPFGYTVDNSLFYTDPFGNEHSKIMSVTESNKTPTAIYADPSTTALSVYKRNLSGNGLADAIFELHYKDTAAPSTYSSNSRINAPMPAATIKLSGTKPTVTGISETTKQTYKYTYKDITTNLSASESDWILPRTDNDYIYFRDYNTGTQNPSDNGGFESYGDGNKYRWLNTWFENNRYGQEKEIGYDHQYWLEAQFQKNGSDMVKYAVWERFADNYNGQKTTVWKIQPPDGYDTVRFCLYQGSTCIRTTAEFRYVLGNIYTKTGKGTNGDNWDYPVIGEHWSTNWNGTGAGTNDQRMDYSTIVNSTGTNWTNTDNYVFNGGSGTSGQTSPKQSERYTATEQKIIFHCNSKQVWHNIHIQFFTGASGGTAIGQEFPGYMMEPYAKANDEYRINGYLTYELTIPKDATYFQINNGILSGDYAYKTAKTPLITTANGKKNNGNYYKLSGTAPVSVTSGSDVPLTVWSDQEIKNAGDSVYETYTTQELESDYDFIYFEKPSSGWGNTIYAYFYGGGDLRADNWQRACYSVWPGAAPAGTEFTAAGTVGGTSDIYHYTYSLNPESTFLMGGKTIYKFRIPKGDKTNYSKVIFNDGLSSQSGGNETKVIKYREGYVYDADGNPTKHYEKDGTVSYTGRGDDLYVKNTVGWDDLHIQFYNASGTQILQQGKGYVMQYAGQKDSTDYFKISIPSDAAKFSLNNGMQNGSQITGKYDILRLDTSVNDNDVVAPPFDFTKGRMEVELTSPGKISTIEPKFEESTETTSEPQSTDADYAARGDYIYIYDKAGVLGTTHKFRFYDANGQRITDSSKEYTAIVHDADADSKKWYSIGIPVNAVKFDLIDDSNTITNLAIFAKVSTDTGTSANFTTGDMYYETESANQLTLTYPTFTNTVAYSGTDNYQAPDAARGDDLYLVVANKNNWQDMRITFYNENGAVIHNTSGETEIVPHYVGHLENAGESGTPVDGVSTNAAEAAGDWFKAAIPTGAVSFKAFNASRTSESGDIYRLANRPYQFRTDYTQGDMQYRITDTLSAGSYKLTCLYPVFTEDSLWTLPDHENINSSIPSVTKPTPTSGTNDAPVLYATASDTITYNWTEGTANPNYNYVRFDIGSLGWSTVKAYFYTSDTDRYSPWDTSPTMTQVGDSTVYQITIPTNNYHYVIFHNGSGGSSNQTMPVDLSQCYYGYGYKFIYNNSTNAEGNREVNIAEPSGSITSNGTTTITEYTVGNFVYFFHPNGSVNSTTFDDPTVAYLWENGTGNTTNSSNNGSRNAGNYYVTSTGTQLSNICNDGLYEFAFPTNYEANSVKFEDSDNGTVSTEDFIKTYSLKGHAFMVTNTNNGNQNTLNGLSSSTGIEIKDLGEIGTRTVTTTTNYLYSGTTEVLSGGTTPVSATYQPEDRYGMISSLNSTSPVTNGFADEGNFIKVVLDSGTTIAKPYIRFYDSTNTIIDKPISLTASLNNTAAQPGNGTLSNPYMIRLPKNAKSAELYDDAVRIGSTITLSGDGGSILTVSGTGGGRTVSKTQTAKNSAALQNTTTDEDFVYYKGDLNYAYYYGGTDGEFCAWPGVPASGNYTDNGQNVNVFQIPTNAGNHTKVYPYVIFNNGSSSVMTAAINYAGNQIYTSNGSSSPYGTWSASPITTTAQQKTGNAGLQNEDVPENYRDVHLATVVTGSDGRQQYIQWLKPKSGAEDQVDTFYLDHTAGDIGKNNGETEVRVKQLGDYYWTETQAPTGYKLSNTQSGFTLTAQNAAIGSLVTTVIDEPLPGKALLKKTAKDKVGDTGIGSGLPGATFSLTTKADTSTFIKTAKKTGKSEYYVIPDITGSATDESKEAYIALSQSGEYEYAAPVQNVTITVPDPDNAGQTTTVTVSKLKEYTALVTDENGYIKIENLVWDDYALRETAAPDNYGNLSSPIYFTIGKNNSDITQELTVTNEMQPSYIKLFEHISDKKTAWGDPTFIFRIRQTQQYELRYDSGTETWSRELQPIPASEQKDHLVSLTVNDGAIIASDTVLNNSAYDGWLVESTDEMEGGKREYMGQFHIDSEGRIKVEPGSYEITRVPVSRYRLVDSAYSGKYINGGTPGAYTRNLENGEPAEKVTITDLPAGRTVDVHYYDTIGYYDKFSQITQNVNKFYDLDSDKKNTTLKGIRVENYYVDTSGGYGSISGNILRVDVSETAKFKAYKVYADGREEQITGTDLSKLSIGYEYDSSSKDDERFGHAVSPAVNDFSYSAYEITVANASRYKDSAYKLKASYDSDKFTTAFELVFEKTDSNVKFYMAQVIFENDEKDSTAHTPSNISYFEESGKHAHAYEFTFIIEQTGSDTSTRVISDILHNGVSIGTDSTSWSDALTAMEGSFRILNGYSTHSLDSWRKISPADTITTAYSSIASYVTNSARTPVDGKIDPIIFAAHLT